MQQYRHIELRGQIEQAGDHGVFPVTDESTDHVDLADPEVASGLERLAHAFQQVTVVMPARPFARDTVDAVDRPHDIGGEFLQFEGQFGRGPGHHRQADVLLTQDLYRFGRVDDLFLIPFPMQMDIGNPRRTAGMGTQTQQQEGDWGALQMTGG